MKQKYIYLVISLFLLTGYMQGQSPQLETIGTNAFQGAKIGQGMVLPSSLKTIGTGAFQNTTIPCLDFTKATGLEQIKSNAFYGADLTSYNTLDLRNCANLKCYNTSNINGGSFAGFEGKVLFPHEIAQSLNRNSLQTIGTNAFQGMKLTESKSLDLSGSHKLLAINTGAFQGSNLEKIVLPDSLENMGSNVLAACVALDTIVSHNVIPPALGTTAFAGVDTLTCKLEVPKEALEAYGTADQWKSFLNINEIGTVYYEKGKTDSVFIRINTTGYSGKDFMGYDYDQDRQLGEGQPILKTYRTIEIGEYVWTQENIRFKAAYNTWLNHSQEAIDQELGNNTIPLEDFEEKFGSWVSLHPKLSAYKDDFKVYYKRDSVEQQGWDLPTVTDFAQLFGMAPVISDDPVQNIMSFLGVRQEEVPGATGTFWKGYTNTSGFALTPLGRRHAQEDPWTNPSTGQEELWMNYGRESGFRLKDHPSGMILFSETQGSPINVIDPLTHLCQARYTRKKTDEELGYRLFVDINKDEVIIAPVTQGCSGTLLELAPGIARGVALRYVKKEENRVIKSWTEIQQEAESIRVRISNLPQTDPFKSCVPVTGVTLDKGTLTLKTGDSQILTATVHPEDAVNKNVSWTSSNLMAATVDQTGKVTAVSEGTATITVTTEEGGKTTTCIVRASDNPGDGDDDDDDDEEDINPEDCEVEFVYDLSGNRIKRMVIILETRAANTPVQQEIFTDNIKNHTIKIYPNPTEGQLSVEILNMSNEDSGNLAIFNMRGQVVTKRVITQGRISLDISEQAAGTYLFRIDMNGETNTWKIIKK